MWAIYSQFRSRKAREVFAGAPENPRWLDSEELEKLQAEFSPEAVTYQYDRASVEKRGEQRARELLELNSSEDEELNRFLELGSWDGMVCYYLQQMGKTTVGIDMRPEGFSNKAKTKGAFLLQMDASQLGFRDNSFDFAFSYNSFEHFSDPEQVLQEALRIVRPGGYIYLKFGPIWMSPRGAHQYRAITVPYCECLFTKELLQEFAHLNDLELADFSRMNQWTVTQYRRLWENYSSELQHIFNYEIYRTDHVGLIERYPSCFTSKTNVFDDLIISDIEALFRKVKVTQQ